MIFGLKCYSQNKELDSLKIAFKLANHDTTRIRLLVSIGDRYSAGIPDTALIYYQKALDLVNKVIAGSSSSTKNHPGFLNEIKLLKHTALRKTGNIYVSQKAHDKAIEYYLKAIAIAEETGNKAGLSRTYANIGIVYYNQKNYSKTLEYDLKALKISEEQGDRNELKKGYVNVGSDYEMLDSNELAIGFYNKSLAITEEMGDKKGIATCYNKMGLNYLRQGKQNIALEFFFKCVKIFEELGDKSGMAASYGNIGDSFFSNGKYDEAREYVMKSLEISEVLDDKIFMTIGYRQIGDTYLRQGLYDKALEYLLKSLKISEASGIKMQILNCYNDIGALYSELKLYLKSIEYHLKSLKISEELGDKRMIAMSNSNVGLNYYYLRMYDKALVYQLKSLKISEETGDKTQVSICYVNIAVVYAAQGLYEKAIEYYFRSLKLSQEIGDKFVTGANYKYIADLYITIADSSENLSTEERAKNLNSAIRYGNAGYNYAQEISSVSLQNGIASELQKAYTKLGKFKEAIKYASIFIATQDSLFNEAKTKALTEMSVKYETEKKQLQLEKMEKQKELDNKTIEAQHAENRKQQVIIIAIIGILVIVLVFSIIVLRMFRQKRKANILLAKQKEEISTQRDMLSQQNIILTEQKKEITDSIRYAKRIQSAILPGEELSKNIFGEHFILFRPKDIVSGDFYWGININEWRIITVADCTGHGVPGAFMSLLGISFLNEIVRKKEITKASEIIEHLRSEIIEALQQKGATGEAKDGMDIVLCVLNTATKEVQFCGANNNLIIVTSTQELKEIPSDKMPVAIYENMKPFTNHSLSLNKGDTIYLASDGFEDQFGGHYNKKFKMKQLKSLLIDISNRPMNEQWEILDSGFEKWKGENEQTDDVTILGVRL